MYSVSIDRSSRGTQYRSLLRTRGRRETPPAFASNLPEMESPIVRNPLVFTRKPPLNGQKWPSFS
jgi:hypothetical protein